MTVKKSEGKITYYQTHAGKNFELQCYRPWRISILTRKMMKKAIRATLTAHKMCQPFLQRLLLLQLLQILLISLLNEIITGRRESAFERQRKKSRNGKCLQSVYQ